MNRMLAQQAAAETIRRVATQMGLQGVGGALVVLDGETVWNPTLVVVGNFQRGPDPNRGEDDTGTNYAAVGFSKLAEMIDTEKNSGTQRDRKPKKGEFGYLGGVMSRIDNMLILTFFSGGTENEDNRVAKPALNTLRDVLAVSA
ncbi:hypothetical protein ACFLZ4_02425 [Patescibacteria group bacterium]